MLSWRILQITVYYKELLTINCQGTNHPRSILSFMDISRRSFVTQGHEPRERRPDMSERWKDRSDFLCCPLPLSFCGFPLLCPSLTSQYPPEAGVRAKPERYALPPAERGGEVWRGHGSGVRDAEPLPSSLTTSPIPIAPQGDGGEWEMSDRIRE